PAHPHRGDPDEHLARCRLGNAPELDRHAARLDEHSRAHVRPRHLTAPIARPRTSCFWAIQPAAMTGSTAIVEAAESTARNCPRPSTKLARNGGVVRASWVVRSVAKKYSFH